MVQVIRSEYVTNVPVEVLGKVGPERVQITGAFRPTDALIVSTSVPLLPGTLVRFAQGTSSGSGIEGTTPSPARQGVEAGITPPSRTAGTAPAGTSRTRAPARQTQRPANRPAPAGNANSTPF
jgi:hypothetical protein